MVALEPWQKFVIAVLAIWVLYIAWPIFIIAIRSLSRAIQGKDD
jgi:hypothetical protein